MAKKNKKRAKATTETAAPYAPTTTAPKHLNPFYIEPVVPSTTSASDQSWDGDYTWSEQEEHAGLLVPDDDDDDNPGNHDYYNSQTNDSRRRRRHTIQDQHMGERKIRHCIVVSVLLLITAMVWALLSTVSRTTDSSTNSTLSQTKDYAPSPVSSPQHHPTTPQAAPHSQDTAFPRDAVTLSPSLLLSLPSSLPSDEPSSHNHDNVKGDADVNQVDNDMEGENQSGQTP